jgi:hypothetical protein
MMPFFLRRSSWLILGLLGVLPSPMLHAQNRPPVPPEYDTHAFRFILQKEKLQPIPSLNQPTQVPEDTILIFFGDTKSLDQLFENESLKRFIEQGSAVLIATDRQTRGILFRDFKIQVDGTPISGIKPSSCYGGILECPLVHFLEKNETRLLEPRKGASINKTVATNKPSFLEAVGTDTDWRLFAELKDVYPSGSRRPYFFGAAQILEKGKILVLSDHSVFINGMMLQDDNGNFDFADNCVKWLMTSKGDPGTKRTKVLFVDEGYVHQTFDVPLTIVPDLPHSPVDLVNHVITKLEDVDFFNSFLERIGMDRIKSTVAIVLTIGLIVYCFYRLAKASYHLEPHVPLVNSGVAQLIPPGAMVSQRHRTLIQSDNFWEAARDVARELFSAIVPVHSSEPRYKGGIFRPDSAKVFSPPILTIKGGGFQSRRKQRKINNLWRLAYGARPRRISRRQFVHLVSQVEEIKTALQDGTLHISGRGDIK